MSNKQQKELLTKKRFYESLITSRLISAREINSVFHNQPPVTESSAGQVVSRQMRENINRIHLQCQAMIAEYNFVMNQLRHN